MINVGLKTLSVLMLFQVRLGLRIKSWGSPRPLGRNWTYDLGCLYLGSYSYLLSHILGMKAVYDPKLDEMCQKLVKSGKKVNAENILDYTTLHPWKAYFYWFDIQCARIF